MARLSDGERQVIITDLATNCDCWKGENTLLNQFNDDKLIQLQKAKEKANQNNNLISNALKGFTDGKGNHFRMDDQGRWLQGPISPTVNQYEDDEEEEDEGDMPSKDMKDKRTKIKNKENKEEKPSSTPTPSPKRSAIEEWCKTAPPDVAAVVMNALQTTERERDSLVERLLTNVQEGETRNRLTSWFKSDAVNNSNLADLQVLLLPVERNAPQSPLIQGAHYLGAATVPGITANTEDQEDYLPLPIMNYDHARVNPSQKKA